MLLILKSSATYTDLENLLEKLKWMGLVAHPSGAEERYAIAVVQGMDRETDFELFEKLPMVEKVVEFKHPFKLAAREFKGSRTVIDVNGVKIGGGTLAVMAGPCSIESKEQIEECASIIASENVKILRGGAFKPRTSPYSFQGMGEEGLRYMRDAADKHGLVTITEVMDTDQIELVAEYADILQVGARNMQNFSLMKKLGTCKRPIFLKRGLSATYQDLLMSAEYILDKGNPNVMLCERGIRTYETYSRNTLDLAAVPILHHLSHLPVIADPSHGTGIRMMVTPMARASVAAGADGIMIEVHPRPDEALSDKAQTISPEAFSELMTSLRTIGPAVGIKVP